MKKPDIDQKEYMSESDIGSLNWMEREKRRLAAIPPDQMTEWDRCSADYHSKDFSTNLEDARQLPVADRGTWEITGADAD